MKGVVDGIMKYKIYGFVYRSLGSVEEVYSNQRKSEKVSNIIDGLKRNNEAILGITGGDCFYYYVGAFVEVTRGDKKLKEKIDKAYKKLKSIAPEIFEEDMEYLYSNVEMEERVRKKKGAGVIEAEWDRIGVGLGFDVFYWSDNHLIEKDDGRYIKHKGKEIKLKENSNGYLTKKDYKEWFENER